MHAQSYKGEARPVVTTVSPVSTIDRIRRRLGLSEPLMLRLLDVDPRHRSILHLPDSSPYLNPRFVAAAEKLERTYDQWKADILATVEQSGVISVQEFALLLGVSWSKVLKHVHENRLATLPPPPPVVRRRYLIPAAAVAELFDENERYYDWHPTRPKRGPLALPIYRLLSHNRRRVSVA